MWERRAEFICYYFCLLVHIPVCACLQGWGFHVLVLVCGGQMLTFGVAFSSIPFWPFLDHFSFWNYSLPIWPDKLASRPQGSFLSPQCWKYTPKCLVLYGCCEFHSELHACMASPYWPSHIPSPCKCWIIDST